MLASQRFGDVGAGGSLPIDGCAAIGRIRLMGDERNESENE